MTGDHTDQITVPEDMWPSSEQELFPFIVITSEHFNGFEELEEDDFPVLVEALSEATTAHHIGASTGGSGNP